MMSNKLSKNPILFGLYLSWIHKKWAIAAISFVFVATALSRVNVVVLGNLTDAFTAVPLDMNKVWLWAIVYPVLFFFSENTWRGSGFTGMKWFMNFRFSGYQSLYEYLTLHSKDYFNSRFAGTISNKITNAVDGSQGLFEKMLWQFSPLILGLLWFTGIAFSSNYILGLILGIWSVLFLITNAIFAKVLHPRSVKSAETGSTLKGKIVDSLSNISLVHEYAYIDGEREYIKDYVTKDRKAGLSLWWLSEWMLLINGVMIFIFMAVFIGTSVFLFQHKVVSSGVIIMVIAMALKLGDQLLFLGMELRDATRYFGEAKEGLSEILKKHLIVDAPDAVDLKIINGAISVESIDFDYENKRIFKSFSLQIPAGQKIGLVGKSGAGKTTFVSLLLRHFDVKNGEIKIDDQSIAQVTLESLRRAIGFIPQDTSLFHRTIKENIKYSNPSATDEDIIRAAKFAHADVFIQELPQGYETLVGERGVKLSGGQRQRIAIARAFLKNAPILILDEATSSLDSESEHTIQESLNELMKGRTVIAIAHRLSTLKKMDRLVVIENGVIVEDGNAEELLTHEKGLFKTLWDHQVKGFIIDK